MFKDTKYNNIKALIDVGGVSWIAEDMDVVGAGIIKELKGVVGVVAINNREVCMTIGHPCCTFLKVGEPDYSQFAICPPFL